MMYYYCLQAKDIFAYFFNIFNTTTIEKNKFIVERCLPKFEDQDEYDIV
eukprot:COSAG01_NODE_11648_length_1887_cov_1.855226_2_plen_49_part_00